MIKSAKEARALVKLAESGYIKGKGNGFFGYKEAKLGLKALDWPEVQELLIYLKRIKQIPEIPEFDSAPIAQVDAMCDLADEALEKFNSAAALSQSEEKK